MDSIITVKTAQRAAQAARAAAKAAVVTVKAIAKATALAIKAIIAGTKALIAAIAAGGWVAVLVIIVICLIGMILGSVFGIFFSDEDSGTGMSMQTVVQEINTEYDTKLQEEKNSVSYDVLEMSGSRAVWKEVLAVYSVKTNTDQDNPQEVATMDDGKKQLLKDIFWEMNQISSRTESKTETVITETDDGHGNIVETESTVTQTYLYITVSHKTAEEMAAQYGFNEEQKGYLAELLADENNYLWSQVLYGITGGDGQIVTVALSLVGNVGGQPYWSWYGFKPFNPLEVVARVKTQLRRYQSYNSPNLSQSEEKDEYDIRGLLINRVSHKCYLYGKEIALTPLEFSILWYLCEHQGKVVASEELFEAVWKEKYLRNSNNTVMAHIGRLREKLNEPSKNPKFIKTVWGVGYEIE